ncbi:hypothetical protein L2E82_36271 [Cichorium intybus]|uniref:Uncharacterized protein n=1 Tax=Cichorium intybus TaxID=13427 RepID=A0ACB9BR66_CICIN|nr:hypothetical protein L2E82_36271 [Cichorium intybus]
MNILNTSVSLISLSTNDIIVSLPDSNSENDVLNYVRKLMLLKFFKELYTLGARKIAVLGAPPVGCLPLERTTSGGILRMCVQRKNDASQLFNSMLREQLPILANSLPQSTVAYVDFYNPLITGCKLQIEAAVEPG